jgi:DNA-binding response OmpR family regulator
MANILIVEDDKAINDLISMNLKLVGHTYIKAYSGKDVMTILKEESIDIVLLDIMLPDIDGFEVMEQIKNSNIPVIFITAKNSLSDKMKGFELGAEDYITKPFETLELLARINIVLRHNNKTDTFILDNVEVYFSENKVFVDGKIVDLTFREFKLLETFITNRNIVLSREKLLELAWGIDYEGDTRTVDVHIVKLRKKLGWENKIKTVFKTGYRLEVK